MLNQQYFFLVFMSELMQSFPNFWGIAEMALMPIFDFRKNRRAYPRLGDYEPGTGDS